MAHDSDQEKQDQWSTLIHSIMEDTNAITIEFLRVRLLAERAVSKSARKRADELAKRVAELEEQLKTVSLQRKKAEKATSDILAILEENGFADFSEAFDSISEHASFSETKMDKSSSETGSYEKEELSVSEHDSFPVPGRSLSWKGRKNELNSSVKLKESLVRRQRSCESIYFSSPKPRHGKSCRQIKRRESRSVAEGHKAYQNMVDFKEKGAETSSEVLPRSTEETPNTIMEGSEMNADADAHMVRALENQQQLIGRFEDMERVQREWEEKFKEINISTMDSCDPANHSDVTEENYETKTQAQNQGVSVVSFVQEARCAPTEGVQSPAESIKSRSHVLRVDSEPSEDNKLNAGVSESAGQDFALPGGTEKDNPEYVEKEHFHSKVSDHHHHLYENFSRANQSAFISPSNSESNSCKESSRIQKVADALVPLETSNGCSSVLKALKQARLSLHEKVQSSPLPKAKSATEALTPSLPAARANQFTLPAESVFARKNTEPITHAADIGGMLEIPVGCAGLFRVPTDASAESSKSKNFLSSGSKPSLTSYYPDAGIIPSSGDRLFTQGSNTNLLSSSFQTSSPNRFPNSNAPLNPVNRLLTPPYVGGSSLLRSGFPASDPLFTGIQRFRPYTSMSNVTVTPISSTASGSAGNDPTPTSFYSQRGAWMPPRREGFSTFYHNRSIGQLNRYE